MSRADFDVVSGPSPAPFAAAATPINDFGDKAEAAVREWFHGNFHGSPIARHTEAWSYMQAVALPRLIEILRTL